MINRVILVGRLTKDPALRKTANGTSVATFTVACDRRFQGQNQENQADFINCVAWRQSADFLSQYASKGRLVGVEGRIQTRSYDDQTGKRVYVTEVVCDSVRLLDEILDYNIKKDVNGFDLYLLCTEIVNCGVKLINRLFHTTPATLRVAETYSRLDKAVALDQYREICKNLIEQAVEYIRINKREEDYIISYILDYVENNYTEDIYLNLFAEKLKLTPAYISSYFKSKMNVNLSDYINSFRIKKAVAMVEDAQNPMLKNKEIAEKVGIQNINTFIRLFKKYTGYTPGDYRKKNVSE